MDNNKGCNPREEERKRKGSQKKLKSVRWACPGTHLALVAFVNQDGREHASGEGTKAEAPRNYFTEKTSAARELEPT